MTTNTPPELHTLAEDPQAFDTVLARLHGQRDGLAQTVASFIAKLHSIAGDKKSYRGGRSQTWGLGDRMVEEQAQRKAAHADREATLVIERLAVARALLAATDFEISNMNAVYALQGNRWTRFFPSVTDSHPHIHRSLSCRTLHATTRMSWAPQMSGMTDEVAVHELDEALCSVCFPDAPVALHNYVSRRSQVEQEARQLVINEREQAKARKNLTEAEQFRTVGTFTDRVTTVAKCKELIRKPGKALAELEWTRVKGATVWTDAEDLARVIKDRESKLAEAETNAHTAEARLLAREVRQEGTGATVGEIQKMRTTSLRNARKEWAKN